MCHKTYCKLSHQTCSVPQAPDFFVVPRIVNFLPHNVDGCAAFCNWEGPMSISSFPSWVVDPEVGDVLEPSPVFP